MGFCGKSPSQGAHPILLERLHLQWMMQYGDPIKIKKQAVLPPA
jgi:hypothetical protein